MASKSTFKYPFPEPGTFDRNRMKRLVEDNYLLNRSAVNPDTDKLTYYLQKELSGNITEAESGTFSLKWKIPDNWLVRHGRLSRLNGEVLVDFAEHPMYLWTHSISFKGEIKREDLIQNHIYSDPNRPNEYMYHYMHGYKENIRTWGFSVPHSLIESMSDDSYYVDIDADLDNNNTLKIVDTEIQGELEDTIFIMAHTCHPGMVSDGIACIAVGNEIFHALKAKGKTRYSYRFIYGPEYWGGAAWLDKSEPSEVNKLKYGIFLDMLSTHETLGFQDSAFPDSRIDRITLNVMKSHTNTYLHKDYRKLWGNDETFYNGPGFHIPTIGIGRGMHREYHYNTDDLSNMSLYNMEDSCWVLMRIIEVFETDYVPLLQYNGPLYLSRYGLFLDPYQNREGYDALEKMQILANGKKSCFEIAEECGVDFFFVRNFFDRLIELGLSEKNSDYETHGYDNDHE